VKFDSLHQVQWDKSFGGYNADLLHSLQVTADGGYILAGEARSELSGDKTENCYNFDIEDYWVIRLNSTGNILWQKIYGGYFKDEAYSIIITKDKGYLVGGFSASNISFDKTTNSLGGRDFWLLKLAENTVGLQQPNGSHQTLVYPNPANQVLAVNTGDVEHIGIQIYDMFGRLIQTRLTQNIETVLPVHDLVAGFYVVEILFANQTKVRKVFSKHH
jgi:hypothetical protein